jgi:hypothetical protein
VSAASPPARAIPLGAHADWDAALRGVPHGIAHTREYCAAMAVAAGRPIELIAIDAPGGRALCPVTERRFAGAPDAVTPYGMSGFATAGDVPDLAARWRAFAEARGWVSAYIAQNPLLGDLAAFPASERHRHNSVFALDLTVGEERLWAGLSTNRRRQLRGWPELREGLVTDRGRLTDFLVREYSGFMARRAAGPAYRMDAAGLERLCAMPGAFLVGAGDGDRLEAASLFAATPDAGDFVFNVSAPGGERHSTALIWYAALRMREAGVPVINLGGGVRDDDRLAEFKRRFGARKLPLASLRQVFRAAAHRRLCAIAGADADRRDGFFPPYHALAAGEPAAVATDEGI